MNTRYFMMFLLMVSMMSAVSAGSDFQIDTDGAGFDGWEITDGYTNKGEPGERAVMSVNVHNTGEAGTQRIECGIYKLSSVEAWHPGFFSFLSTVSTTNNCMSGETFVDTKIVSLNADERVSLDGNMKFEVKVPNYPPGNEYVWHCWAYESCWADVQYTTQDIGSTDYFYVPFTIEEGNVFVDECLYKSDCVEFGQDFQCIGGDCKYVAPPPDPTPDPDPDPDPCVGDDCGGDELNITAVVIAGLIAVIALMIVFFVARRFK